MIYVHIETKMCSAQFTQRTNETQHFLLSALQTVNSIVRKCNIHMNMLSVSCGLAS